MAGEQVQVAQATLFQNRDYPALTDYKAFFAGLVQSVYAILWRKRQKASFGQIILKCLKASRIAARLSGGQGCSRLAGFMRLGASLIGRPQSAFTCAIQQVLGENPCFALIHFAISA